MQAKHDNIEKTRGDARPVGNADTSIMRDLQWTRKQHERMALQLSHRLPTCGPRSKQRKAVTRAICDHLIAVVSDDHRRRGTRIHVNR